MSTYTAEEYTDMIITYGLAGENTTAAERLYAERFPKRDRCPSSRIIYNCVLRARLTGSVLPNREDRYVESSTSAKKRQLILKTVGKNPGKSIRQIARMLNLSRSMVHRVIKQSDYRCNTDDESSSDEELEELPKRRLRKIRKKKTVDDLMKELKAQDNDCLQDLSSRSKRTKVVKDSDGTLDVDDSEGFMKNVTEIKVEDKNIESELHGLQNIKQETKTPDENEAINIVLNSTAESGKTSKNDHTYAIVGNRKKNGKTLMAFEFVGIRDDNISFQKEHGGCSALNTMYLDELKAEPVTSETMILDPRGYFLVRQ